MMMTAFLLAALLLTVASLSLAESHHYYASATGGKDCPADSECHNLSHYLSDPELYFTSNTRITFLEGTHLLDREDPINISQVTGLTLMGSGKWIRGSEETIMESTAVIYCTNGRGGFAFYNSSQIAIISLSLINCGAIHAKVKSTLFFLAISELNLRYVSIQNSTEHGIIAHNCHHIEIYSCSVAYSNIEQTLLNSLKCNISSSIYGSNLLIVYYRSGSKSHLNVSNSNFTDACGDSFYGNLVVHAESNKRYIHVSLRKIQIVQKMHNSGSGLVILSRNTNVIFNFSDSTITGAGKPVRYAKGLYVKTYLSTVQLNMERVTFYNNPEGQLHFQFHNGTVSGLLMNSIQFLNQHVVQKTFKYASLGVFISLRDAVINVITFKNLSISLNNAFHNGFLFQIMRPQYFSQTVSVNIIDSTFNANQNMKSVLSLEVNNPVNIINCQFFNNSGDSVISVSTADKLFFTDVMFISNIMTAIAVWNGVVQFRGRNEIQKNHKTAVYLQGTSRMSVKGNSVLAFFNNTSGTVGGAIRVYDIRTFQSDHCSILVSNDSQIIFSGNRAVEGGGDVYGARLVGCLDIDNNHVPRQGLPNETSWYFNIPQSYNMQFSNTKTHSSISSDPIMVCFCNNGHPNCSKRLHSRESLFPGEEVITEIATVGYYGGTSSGTVSIAVHNCNASLVRPYGPQGTTARCLELHLLLDSSGPTSASVAITVNGGIPGWGVNLVVDIMECPPGFYKNDQSGRCECAPILKNYDIYCNASDNASYFRRSGNNWFAYLINRTCLTAYTDCPFDYCNSHQVTFNIIDPDDQCTGGREGVLCGQCQPGLSLLLGSNRCASCSNVYLLLVLVFALAGIVLVGVIMALNLTVSVGAVNGLLLYANMVKLNESVFFPNGRPPVVSQFISWLNLDFGIELCLFNGLDGYWKTWLQFVFPFYLFLIMGTISLSCKYSAKVCRLCGSNAVPALATLFLMSYTKVLQTVTNALSISHLICNGTPLKVWSVDGNIDYFSVKHLILVIFSGCVLIVGVAYPVLVLFAPLLERYSDKCIPSNWNPVSKMKPLLDAYGGPYKDRHRYWTGVTLLVRLLVTIVFSFSTEFLNSIILAIIVQVFFLIWLTARGIYKYLILNILNALFLFNLFALAISSLLFRYMNQLQAQEVTTIVSTCLSLLGLLAIIFGTVWSKLKKTRPQLQKLHQWINRSLIRPDSTSEYLGSPPSRVYESLRGEHQFDLHLPENIRFTRNISSPSCAVLREREPLLFSAITFASDS